MDGTFFSPSYISDLQRMVWLRRSIERFLDAPVRHIVAVPRADLSAFKRRLGNPADLELICQEDLVDRGFYPDRLYRMLKAVAPGQAWRLKARAGKPGWIIQQIVKLASYQVIENGPIIFLDSDIFFYRPFSLEKDLGLSANKRVLVRLHPEEEGARHPHHISNARRFFGLPPGRPDTVYMGYPAIWYPDWLRQMHAHIEGIKGVPWQTALLKADFNISEYTLYGVYIDEILKPEGLAVRGEPFNLIAWDRPSFERLRSDVFNGNPLAADKLVLCIQSNINIPVEAYEDILKRLLARPAAGTVS